MTRRQGQEPPATRFIDRASGRIHQRPALNVTRQTISLPFHSYPPKHSPPLHKNVHSVLFTGIGSAEGTFVTRSEVILWLGSLLTQDLVYRGKAVPVSIELPLNGLCHDIMMTTCYFLSTIKSIH